MTLDELKNAIAHVDSCARLEKKRIYYGYVAEHAQFKVRDIITDGSDIILIERIDFKLADNGTPIIYYHGEKLTRTLMPRKIKTYRVVYEERAQLVRRGA